MAQINKTSEQVIREYSIDGAEPIQLTRTSITPRRVLAVFEDGQWVELRVLSTNYGYDTDFVAYTPDDDRPLPEWAMPLTKYEEE